MLSLENIASFDGKIVSTIISYSRACSPWDDIEVLLRLLHLIKAGENY